MPFGSLTVRETGADDGRWVRAVLEDAWGSVWVARKGELLDASSHTGFIAFDNGQRVGLAVVVVRGDEFEVLSLSTVVEGRGVGRALMLRCFDDARARGCRRVWLTTTNNNTRAIAFYQRLGMDLCAFHRNAVAVARHLKPSISLRDDQGIAIAHELEFELILADQ